MLARETIQLLRKYNIKLNRRKGQNYLINNHILSLILEHGHLEDSDVVLEIGAGIGTLTIPLAEKASQIIAVEQDKKIASILKERLRNLGISNVTILEGDATRMEFPYFNKVVSNLPYQISSPITFQLLQYDFDFAILMYQLEFAERMVAEPGESNYSRLSVMTNLFSDVKMLFKVPRDAFIPKPRVSSGVIRLTPKKNHEVDEFLVKTCRALFQHKRKKSKKALLESFHEITNKDENSYLSKNEAKMLVSQLDQGLMEERVFKLTPNEILAISQQLKKLMVKNGMT